MPKGNLEERIEQVRHLASGPATDVTIAALRKALSERASLVVAQAAKVTGRLGLRELFPDLVDAFERMLQKGAAADPKCWAKRAIVDALKAADFGDSSVFVRGLRHIQMEPVWGGQEDTAVPLRGSCGLALVQCVDITRHLKFRYLVDAMADGAEAVRLDVVRAVTQLDGDDATLLLRLKVRVGDSSPRVIGQAMEGVVSIEGESGVRFVESFLQSSDDDMFQEASLALGASRREDALGSLLKLWSADLIRRRGEMVLRAVSACGLPRAIDFLFDIVENGTQRESDAAVEALKLYSSSDEIQQRIRDTLKERKPAL